MTDSLKERYYFKGEHDAAFDEALARIEELEQRGEELGGAVEEQIIEKRALQATIAKLEGENKRLQQESNYFQLAANHANEREEEAQASIERLREALEYIGDQRNCDTLEWAQATARAALSTAGGGKCC